MYRYLAPTDEMTRLSLLLLKAFYALVMRTWLLMVLVALVAGASLLASFATGQWHWFQRSGALIVSIGAILSTRPLLRNELMRMIRQRTQDLTVPAAAVPGDVTRQDRSACFCGFWVVGTGTLTWAYGDLLGCLVTWSAFCVSG